MDHSPRPVLFFDGECGLCAAVVRFMLRRDRRGALRFAPLQGATAQAFLRSRGMDTEDFDSLVFVADLGRADSPHHLRTTGALLALAELGGGWPGLARVLLAAPAGCRDVFYKGVARMRYRLFGRRAPVPPKPEWAGRFLD